ncbi:hypothetical protein [Neptuniibacter sp. 2_MG-2023]|uniref:hypothetical protein n=1 Tax=Neptuniibacter sp. 2_MG-2023 TaxID=3062671 RepID=UPI0026E1850A|nr:hypothetical protein [Neptuniibacter sp. 2_MG-2023]MDO6514402.1 hypothetical protein [Neptuniibacter sp. 2_MG-2023]
MAPQGNSENLQMYFSDFFNVAPAVVEEYGAFDVSLINDLPLFVDPFLLFNSEKPEYIELHDQIIKYVGFLRDRSSQPGIHPGLLKSWFCFPEVKQNWFGYSSIGNGGSGLGAKFATALNENLHAVFTDFGQEQVTQGSHLEKLCLIRGGVGRDSISDFTTNLIKEFLLDYTQKFADQYIDDSLLEEFIVQKVCFNYKTRTWVSKSYILPSIDGDYVLLTPKDILTKDDTWINKAEMFGNFNNIVDSIPNSQLRAQLSEYLSRMLPDDPDQKEFNEAVTKTILKHPEYIDYFIKLKEDTGDQASKVSEMKVADTERLFIVQAKDLVVTINGESEFYNHPSDTFEEAYQKVLFLKQVIESNDGYRFFYNNDEPIKRESDLQLLFKLTWHASPSSTDAEVNNGRGPVDFKISRGAKDSTLVEFKLASNTKLKQNLKHQVEVYKEANQTNKAIKVILYFSFKEYQRVKKILTELDLKEGKEIVLIDAQQDNKISASNITDAQLDLLSSDKE